MFPAIFYMATISYLSMIIYIFKFFRKEIQEINWERKSSQTSAGEKLISLESTWVQLVSKNYDIEQACVSLENEISQLQQVLNNKTT